MFCFYCDNRVSRIEEMPTGSHFAAIIFDTKTTWTPPYDRHDSPDGTTDQECVTEHYVFTDEDDLKLFLKMAHDEKKKVVFYHVPKLGSMQVEVNVKLS